MSLKIDRREFLIASGSTAGLAAVSAGGPLWAKAPRVRVVGLKVDEVDHPLGLESASPRLSWRIESSDRNVRQSAYRVWVASSEERAQGGQGDLWDSGKVSGRRSIGVAYQGRALRSRERCFWGVQVWD